MTSKRDVFDSIVIGMYLAGYAASVLLSANYFRVENSQRVAREFGYNDPVAVIDYSVRDTNGNGMEDLLLLTRKDQKIDSVKMDKPYHDSLDSIF